MDPKSIASTNSANSACIDDIFIAVIVRTGLYKTFSLKVVRTFLRRLERSALNH